MTSAGESPETRDPAPPPVADETRDPAQPVAGQTHDGAWPPVAGETRDAAQPPVAGPPPESALEQARAVADAVLYEGYLLYPYRASATKNQVRWQWGVLMPPACAALDTGEHSYSRTELLAEPTPDAVLHVRLRFLQLQTRTVHRRGEAVASAIVGGAEYTSWQEAVEREVDAVLPVAELLSAERVVPFEVDGGIDIETLSPDVRLVRGRERLRGVLRLRAEPLPGPFGGVRLALRVVNTGVWQPAGEPTRDDALRFALIGAHTLLALTGGVFLSALDPPEWAWVATEECAQERAWPVLVGPPEQRDTVLCSPIILYDHPSIAEQSAGELYDGTEIDEILTLRTMTLTDEEKRQARATDPRAADLIDRVDNLPPELMDRLHGTIHYLRSVTSDTAAADRPAEPAPPQTPWWDPGADASVSPETDSVLVDGVPVAKGSRVRLRPGKRADAHDMFLVGRTAVVAAVLRDVDDGWHIAVTLEDDPGADLYAAHGRYRYFAPDEVEPL